MRDQAEHLRALMGNNNNACRTIAITSGKGGVGKSNLALNLALALAQLGKRVALLDADIGLANIEVLLGVTPRYNLRHVIYGCYSLMDISIPGPLGTLIVPGGAGLQEMADLDSYQREKLLREIATLESQADVLIIDTGAGIGRNVLAFVLAAEEVIIVLTPEPTSLADGYAMLKAIKQAKPWAKVGLVINRVSGFAEATRVAQRIQKVSREFLGAEVSLLGGISEDFKVGQAVRQQQPVGLLYPQCSAYQDIQRIAWKLGSHSPLTDNHEARPNLVARIWGWLSRGNTA